MHLRDRELVSAADPTEPAPHPFEGATVMVVPAPLPDLHTAFSRRAALFGPVLGAAAALAVSPPAKAHVALPAADAVMVDLAARTVALAQRHEEVTGQICDAQGAIDKWNFANKPKAPELPDRPSRMVVTKFSTETHCITQFAELLDDEPDADALIAYKEAREAHKRATADKEAASSVPSLTNLAGSLWRDLIRCVESLTDMEPATLAGLAAKASVIEALAETDSDIADDWGQNLGRSMAEDVIRLHKAMGAQS